MLPGMSLDSSIPGNPLVATATAWPVTAAGTWPGEFTHLASIPGDCSYPTLDGRLRPVIRRSSSLCTLPLRPSKSAHWRFPLSVALALGPGALICLVGFLAWGVPFANLTQTISPLVEAVRWHVLTMVAREVTMTWDSMRAQILQQHMKWNVTQQPWDLMAESTSLGRTFQPTLVHHINVISTPVVVSRDDCIYLSVLQRHPILGWVMDRQNCSMRWLEGWDVLAQDLTGVKLNSLPLLTPTTSWLIWPVANTTPAQPFSWLGIYNPRLGVGDLLGANVGLFHPENGTFYGRAAITMSTEYLRNILNSSLENQQATHGGRLVLFEETGMVVATTHGSYDRQQRFSISKIGDPDIEAAAKVLEELPGPWCTPRNMEVKLSQPYFLDTFLIVDNNPSVQPLQWCALLLSPRQNMLQSVDHALSFAIVFVCVMTIGVTMLSFLFGLIVTRPVQQLTKGMRALKECKFASARSATGGRSFFAELCVAQDSYDSLVETIDAFGKYVPQTVVQGLLAGNVRPGLGMVEKTVALAFMDMENFTTMCESTPPGDIVNIACQLFDACCDCIVKSHGSIDKFLGDCIMAMWGAPEYLPLPGHNAVEAIVDILGILRDKPPTLSTGIQIGLRIGLHSGRCLVGNFGATERWDYTAIGDVVNTAARLEPLNKQFGTHCLTSSEIYDQTRASEWLRGCLRPMGNVLLIGKKQTVAVYELLPAPFSDLAHWIRAINMFDDGQLDNAAEYFELWPQDAAAVALLADIHQASATEGCIRIMRAK